MLVYYVPSFHFSLVEIIYTKRRKMYFSKFVGIKDSQLESYGGPNTKK